MKKIFAIAALVLGISALAAAQPKAIGGRLGYGPIEVSYEHSVGSPNFFEINAGVDLYSLAAGHFGAQVSALYNFVLAQPSWTSRGDWEFYAGPGLTTGWLGDTVHKYYEGVHDWEWQQGYMVGIAAQVGLSYTFWFPLNLSVDLRPVLGLHINAPVSGQLIDTKVGLYNQGFTWCWIPTLSVRYAF